MSAPRDQYPNDAWKYPGEEPGVPDSVRPSFGPAVEAELYRLAPSRVTVLLVGGDARERHSVAVALHERSPRARSPFIAFACEGLDFDEVERGLFGGLSQGIERLTGTGERLTARAEAIDEAVRALYAQRRGTLAATTWHFASWIVGGVEVWLALWFLGHPVSLMTALLLESLGHTVRSAAFIVPGALGIQEAGYLALGRVVDLGPDTALALSLAQRVRDLLLGLPGLLAWWMDGTLAAPEISAGHAGEPSGG